MKSSWNGRGLFVDLKARTAYVHGVHVSLGERAFDILAVLIEAKGHAVSKSDLFTAVWADEQLQENRLQVHISWLRKAIAGAARVESVRSLGYRLVEDDAAPHSLAELSPDSLLNAAPPTNLPLQASELIGREHSLAELEQLSLKHSLVTLAGAGGIGKTRLVVEVASKLVTNFPDGVVFVQFSAVTNPDLVAATVATNVKLQIASRGHVTSTAVAEHLKQRTMLLVFDNCEHLSGAVADLASSLLAVAPAIHILTTSREPLNLPSEMVYQVMPLESLLSSDAKGSGGLQSLSAVRLFVARVGQALYRYAPNEEELRKIATICQHLDGLPLAIELAAGRTSVLGVSEVLARFDQSFSLLTKGRRTAVARHQTLKASFDWSYELLSEPAKAALRYCSVFATEFALNAGAAVCAKIASDKKEAARIIESLVSKSLLQRHGEQGGMYYALFETTKSYARRHLDECQETQDARRCHAEYHRDLAVSADAAWWVDQGASSTPSFACRLEDVRVALDWSSSPEGDPLTNIDLTVATEWLWGRSSFYGEYVRYLERAIQDLQHLSAFDIRLAIKLYLIHGRYAYCFSDGPGAVRSFELALKYSVATDNVEGQIVCLRHLWAAHWRSAPVAELRRFAKRFESLAKRSSFASDVHTSARLIAQPLYYQGQHAQARLILQDMLARYVPPPNGRDALRFTIDQRVGALILLAPIQWIEGASDQAAVTARQCVSEALTTHQEALRASQNVPISLAQSLNTITVSLADAAIPIAVRVGDDDNAYRYFKIFDEVIGNSTKDGGQLRLYMSRVRFYRALLQRRRNPSAQSEQELLAAYLEVRKLVKLNALAIVVVEYVESTGVMSTIQLTEIKQSIEEMQAIGHLWCVPELLRLKGTLLLQGELVDRESLAEAAFLSAMRLAEDHKALGWEIGAALSLSKLYLAQGRFKEIIVLLRGKLDQLSATSMTLDAHRARNLMVQAEQLDICTVDEDG